MTVGAIVLCGGTSARMGGDDKTAADLDGRSVLTHLLGSLPAEWSVVCVGEPREAPRDITWTRESPALGGPVAGLQAGLDALGQVDIVVALAGDQPFAGPAAGVCVEALVASDTDVDGAATRQDDGHPQLLLAAYRSAALTRALREADSGTGVYRALSRLHVTAVDAPASRTLDVDTPDDLAAARAHLGLDS